MLGHFGKRLNAFFELWIFFNFFEIFRSLNPPWNSGKKLFLPKKAPKHVWTLGNNLDNLRTLNFFWFFSWICSVYLPQILSPENRIQIFQVQKTDLIFLSLENLKSPAWNTRQKNTEKMPQSMFKTRLDTFENDFVNFGILKMFWFFFKFFKTRPSMEHGAIFFQKKCHKTCSKQVWTFLGTILGFSAVLNFLWFFCENFRWLHGTLGKKLFEKYAPKHVWTLLKTNLGTFGILRLFWFFSLIFV